MSWWGALDLTCDVIVWWILVATFGLVLWIIACEVSQWISGRSMGFHRPREDRTSWPQLSKRLSHETDGEKVYLGSVLKSVKWFGIVGDMDTPNIATATFEMVGDDDEVYYPGDVVHLPSVLKNLLPTTVPDVPSCCGGGNQWGHHILCPEAPD